MKFSTHARARFAERFPGLSPLLEWERAKKSSPGKKTLARIAEACQHSGNGRAFAGCYYRVSAENPRIVFVLGPGDFILTVFELKKK